MAKKDRFVIPAELERQMVEVARGFRKVPTRSEDLLWQALRGGRFHGLRVRRQQPIGPFVVDFYCPQQRLIVEIDGPIHDEQQEHDAASQRLLEAAGFCVLRVTAQDVEHNLPAVLDRLRAATAS